MAAPKEKDRRILHCLRCGEGFEQLSQHLNRKCMNKSTPDERALAMKEAKSSTKQFNHRGRLWSHAELLELIPDEESRSLVTAKMRERFFLFKEELPEHQSTPSTSRTPASTVPSASATISAPQQEEPITLSDVSRVLRKAGPTMEEIHSKITSKDATDTEMGDFRQYCEAIMMLKGFQKPLAVENFTVSYILNLTTSPCYYD